MCTDGIILKMAEKLEKRSLKYFSSYYSLHFIKENMQIKLSLPTLEWHGAQIGSLPDATYMPLGKSIWHSQKSCENHYSIVSISLNVKFKNKNMIFQGQVKVSDLENGTI